MSGVSTIIKLMNRKHTDEILETIDRIIKLIRLMREERRIAFDVKVDNHEKRIATLESA